MAEPQGSQEQDDLSSDIAARLQQPLLQVESSPLQGILNSFHARMEVFKQLHNKDIGDVKQLIDEIDLRLHAKADVEEPREVAAPAVTIQQVAAQERLLMTRFSKKQSQSTGTVDAGSPRLSIGRVR